MDTPFLDDLFRAAEKLPEPEPLEPPVPTPALDQLFAAELKGD